MPKRSDSHGSDQSKTRGSPPSIEALEALFLAAEHYPKANSIHDLAEMMGYNHARLFKHLLSLKRFCHEAEIFTKSIDGRLQLTPGGRTLLEHAEDVVQAHRRIRQQQSLTDMVLCCSTLTVAAFLGPLLTEFFHILEKAQKPFVHVDVREGDPPHVVLDMTRRGGFDVTIRGQVYDKANQPFWEIPNDVGRFEISEPCRYVAVARKGVLPKPRMRLHEVFKLGRVAVQRTDFPSLLESLGPKIGETAVKQNTVIFESDPSVIQMTKAGLCVAIVPKMEMFASPDLDMSTVEEMRCHAAVFMVCWNEARVGLSTEQLMKGDFVLASPAQPWLRKDFVQQFLVVCRDFAEKNVEPPTKRKAT